MALTVTLLVSTTAITPWAGAAEGGTPSPAATEGDVTVPYYVRCEETNAVVHGDISPEPLTVYDWYTNIYVAGPTFPKRTLSRVGVFAMTVAPTTDDIPLRVNGIHLASVWAERYIDDVRDAQFRFILQRNGEDLVSFYSDIHDIYDVPVEFKASTPPTLDEPLVFRTGDDISLEVQYRAASLVGTGPAPDCWVLCNSLDFPTRIELRVVPMCLEVTVPKIEPDKMYVRGRLQDTSPLDPEDDLLFDLVVLYPDGTAVDTGDVVLQSVASDGLETVITWYWYYNWTQEEDGYYAFIMGACYGEGTEVCCCSLALGLSFSNGSAHLDSDGDGYDDETDAFPFDPTEWRDSDDDGHGDNIDAFPHDPEEWMDSDHDGHGDNGDAFPDNPAEWMDSDGDGHGDNGDAFPRDPKEWSDRDGDGFGDNSDEFPSDPDEWRDSDGDGRGDNGDEFPTDPGEWIDSDGDGRGDNGDEFPTDPGEWTDSDRDGHGDNGDAFPRDPLEWEDSDGDGTGDNADDFPTDRAASRDTDGDRHPDAWNPGMTARDSTTGLTLDRYPLDSSRWEEEVPGGTVLGLSTAMALGVLALLVVIVLAAVWVVRSRRSR